VFNHLSIRIHDEDSNWGDPHDYMSGGSVGVEDKYASRDGGGVCGVVTSGAGAVLLISAQSSCILVLNNCIRILHMTL
jgi:hypothetical protein